MRGVFRYLCWLSVLGVCACTDSSFPSIDELAAKYQRNPVPKLAYRIELKLADAPGPFAAGEGFVRYEAPNCSYTPSAIMGVRRRLMQSLPMQLTKIDDATFIATVYFDAMLDEDYQLGEGVCHWELQSVNAWLKATGAKTDTGYVVNLSGDEVIARKSQTNYYLMDGYPGDDPDGWSDPGNQSRDWFKPEFQNQLFAITMTAQVATR
ncbi:hypothetical protein K4L06_09315 [Lysobacter sp. BMK333-48F3]|uniref:hypothetical protein n=1 Tax=Lysobacter sp. BMK333-48F3 TaxID=2867962 RepID=UPI001C8C44F9|nr:hypothetical protein [Lysobacter sp. BMK333-48F3]MBX9401511.1 hypothetical protein [Lysobacter sp. BMK333-48F3]